jgi:hypothetical protein
MDRISKEARCLGYVSISRRFENFPVYILTKMNPKPLNQSVNLSPEDCVEEIAVPAVVEVMQSVLLGILWI